MSNSNKPLDDMVEMPDDMTDEELDAFAEALIRHWIPAPKPKP